MKVMLALPAIGKKEKGKYVKSWQMEPLAIAVLAALTPPDVELSFYDDRVEEIPLDLEVDLVGLSVETFTAKRAYEIAGHYRRRGIKVVMGGYHPTLNKEEALEHCDSVVVGEAENVWRSLLRDCEKNELKPVYESDGKADLAMLKTDRGIFEGKGYFDLSLVETGRGCKYSCEFCSVTRFFGGSYRRRPIEAIVEEIRAAGKGFYFFVDDNVTSDFESAKEMFRALKPLGISWISQASIDIANDDELLALMAESGCIGLLIGFESLSKGNLAQMDKGQNNCVSGYADALAKIRAKGIVVYGAFVLGYDFDDRRTIADTLSFAIANRLFIVAFNHLTPFPGTRVYERLKAEKRLLFEKWWLSEDYRFGEAPFIPARLTNGQLAEMCHQARQSFYGLPSIFRRSLDWKANCRSWKTAKAFFYLNLLLGKEVNQKRNIVLGKSPA